MLVRLLQNPDRSIIIRHLRTVDLGTVQRYIDDKNNINATAGKDQIPLLALAIYAERNDIVELLLQNGADPNFADLKGLTPLWHATGVQDKDKKLEIMQTLKKANARQFAAHPIDIIRKLKYGNIFDYFGVCYGMASVGMDYMMRGVKGIKELDDLLLALGDEDTDAVVERINAIQEFRQRYGAENKPKIRGEITSSLRDASDEVKEEEEIIVVQLRTLHAIFIEENENSDESIASLLDDMIQLKFDLTEEERNSIIANFIRYIRDAENAALTQAEREIWVEIQQEMLTKLIDLYIQKRLDREIRKSLKEKYKIDAVLLDAPNYLQGITFSQGPYFYKKYFERNIPLRLGDQNVFVTFPLISSSDTEKQGFTTPTEAQFEGFFNKNELIDFLKMWREHLKEEPRIDKPVAFMLCTASHAISLAYLPEEDVWAFNNYNGLKTFLIKDEDALAINIFKAFSKEDNQTLYITWSVYSSEKDQGKVNSFQKHLLSGGANTALPLSKGKIKDKLLGSFIFIGGLLTLGFTLTIILTIIAAFPAAAWLSSIGICTIIMVSILSALAFMSAQEMKSGYQIFFGDNYVNKIVRENAEKNNTSRKVSSKKLSHAQDKKAEIETSPTPARPVQTSPSRELNVSSYPESKVRSKRR